MTPSEPSYFSAAAVAVPAPRLSLSPVEFIMLIALMMALTAMSIDLMLPALPAIGEAMGVTDPNDRQIVIISYVIGFALGQLGYGRLSDKYGRKPVLMSGLALFVAGSLAASLASTFTILLAARALQGLGAAAPRVIAIAIVRDLYVGRQMARVMSFAMTVFIIIPVLAPSIGQGLLAVGTWRWSFDALLVVGLVTAAWTALRLPETHSEGADGEPLGLGEALKLALQTPQTIGYALAAGLLFGCLMSYVSSAQQVFVDVFHLGNGFPLAFGAVASLMAIASVTNANLVEQLGMRRLSHTALTGFAVLSILLAGAAASGMATPAVPCRNGRTFLPVRAHCAELQCARHGTAGPQRRPRLLHHRFRDDRSGRGVRRACRPPVRRHCAAADARLHGSEPRGLSGGPLGRRTDGALSPFETLKNPRRYSA